LCGWATTRWQLFLFYRTFSPFWDAVACFTKHLPGACQGCPSDHLVFAANRCTNDAAARRFPRWFLVRGVDRCGRKQPSPASPTTPIALLFYFDIRLRAPAVIMRSVHDAIFILCSLPAGSCAQTPLYSPHSARSTVAPCCLSAFRTFTTCSKQHTTSLFLRHAAYTVPLSTAHLAP